MKMIIKTKSYGDKTVYFDDEDYDLLKDYVWHVTWDKNNFYVRCNIWVRGKRKSPKMHRMVMGVWKKERPHVDHINHNGLDNRKSNLRLATIGQNTKNLIMTKRNTTGYKGVYLYKEPHLSAGLYTAALKANGKKYHGGYFKTAIEAAKKYNEMAIEHHKEFACLNTFGNESKNNVKDDEVICSLKKKYIKSKTGFYGVTTTNNRKSKYTATISINKKPKCIGYYQTAVEAAKAYDKKAKEIHGKGATLNFP